jgi:glycosyltransferase involved in cell wall biosynthesis
LGNIRKHKNVDSLIKAYFTFQRNGSKASLVITQGNDDLRQLVEQFEHRVLILHLLMMKICLPYINWLLVMVFISSPEGFGLPIISYAGTL